MRILYIITKSEAGGAQTHVSQLAQYMVGKGHSVGIMSYPGGLLQETLTNNRQPTPKENKFPTGQANNNKKSSVVGSKLLVRFYPNPYFKNSYNPFLGMSREGYW